MAGEAGQSFVVLGDLGENQCVVVGRNGVQSNGVAVPEVVFFPASTSADSVTKCSQLEVDSAPSFAVILNRTIKTWGADSGANEKGVTIAVSWATNEKELLASDLARLALERSATATEAVDVIAQLNDKYGVEYSGVDSLKVSLLICDPSEVWVMDVVGKYWAAENISAGYRRIPSSLGVATKIDKSYENISGTAQDLTLWDGSGEFNFRESFLSTASKDDFQWPAGDLSAGTFSLEDMFNMLREHCPSSSEAKSSQVSVLSKDKLSCHWFTATNNTKESVFKPFVFTENVRISPLTIYAEDKDPEVTLLVKYHSGRDWTKAGELLKSLEQTCVAEVKEALASGPDPTELEDLMKDCVEAEVKFYR